MCAGAETTGMATEAMAAAWSDAAKRREGRSWGSFEVIPTGVHQASPSEPTTRSLERHEIKFLSNFQEIADSLLNVTEGS